MSKKYLLTDFDLQSLNNELRELIDVKRPQILVQLQEARAHGDLSENSEYDAAKNEQANIEKRISEIKNILDNHEVIQKDNNSEFVNITSIVTYKNLTTNEIFTVEITGSEGSNPWENKISNESPLAMALMRKSVGDKVEINSSDNSYFLEILKIS